MLLMYNLVILNKKVINNYRLFKYFIGKYGIKNNYVCKYK